jgi:uncharacterized membrane protein YhaH (DUF805 family)
MIQRAWTGVNKMKKRGIISMNYYLEVIKKYTVFTGRAGRSEYWYYILFNLIAVIILSIIDKFIGHSVLTRLYVLAVLLPSVGVTMRRLHDTGRDSWWICIVLIPVIGHLILVYFMVQDSEPGENKYGPNPKGTAV